MTRSKINYIMKVGYSNQKVADLCEDYKKSKKKLGNDVSKKLFQKLIWLAAAPNLDVFNSTYRFLRIHMLNGKYDGMYALDITKQYRLIFYPCDEDGNPNTESNFKAISIVMVQEVSKHYE